MLRHGKRRAKTKYAVSSYTASPVATQSAFLPCFFRSFQFTWSGEGASGSKRREPALRLRRQGICSSCPQQPRPITESPCRPSHRVSLLPCPSLHPLHPPTVGAALFNLFLASLTFLLTPPLSNVDTRNTRRGWRCSFREMRSHFHASAAPSAGSSGVMCGAIWGSRRRLCWRWRGTLYGSQRAVGSGILELCTSIWWDG